MKIKRRVHNLYREWEIAREKPRDDMPDTVADFMKHCYVKKWQYIYSNMWGKASLIKWNEKSHLNEMYGEYLWEVGIFNKNWVDVPGRYPSRAIAEQVIRDHLSFTHWFKRLSVCFLSKIRTILRLS